MPTTKTLPRITKLVLLTGLWLVASAAPAWAVPIPPGQPETCVTQATRVSTTAAGEEYYSFDTICPINLRESFDLEIWKNVSTLFDKIDGGTVGADGSVHAVRGPFGPGTYEANIYCKSPGKVDICKPATFTVGGGPTPTPTPGGPGPSTCTGNDIPTGLGCIPTDPTGLVNKILEIAIGVSSGIAMLLLISGAFKVLTSSGDPKAVMEGRETITSAIAGLLLILLSVAILNIIGIKILGIPIWK